MLIDSFCRGVNPGERLTPVEWMARNVVVPHSARNTQFDPATAPWMNEPIAEIAKDSNDEIVICAPVGSGKTTLFEALIAWIIAENPGPTLVTGQTDKTAKQWAESRLAPMLNAIPGVAKLFPRDRHSKRKTEILFRHMPLFIGGANLTSLQEKSIRWAIADEVWRWKDGMLEEFRRRTHDRWNARRILVSQGGIEGDDFHDAEDLCERRDFAWRCASCNEWAPWDFADVKFDREKDSQGRMDWLKVSDSAELECPKCKARYRDDPRIRRKLSTESKYLVVGKGAPNRIAFHYDAAAVWWIPWGSLAVEWTKAEIDSKSGDTEALKQFRQKRNARRWEEKGTGATDESVLACRGNYMRGSCPIEPLVITISADVGQDTSHWVCQAWAADGASYVLQYGTVTGVDDLEEVVGGLSFKTPEGRDVAPVGGMIDSGFNTNAVYRFCNASGGFFFPAKGSGANFGSISESVLKEYPTLPLYTVNEFASKVSLFLDRIEKRKPPFFSFPMDADEEFLRAFMNQRIVTNKKGRKEWRLVAGDHYADAVRLNYACAQHLRKSGAIEFAA